MHRTITVMAKRLFVVIAALLLAACAFGPQSRGAGGSAQQTRTFGSNGERIYFTATSERGIAITSTGGPMSNGGMMGGGMRVNGQFACATCHGSNGKGGQQSTGMMQGIAAKDIRWSALQSEFDAEKFRLAVTQGQDPNGTQLSTDMPRWSISDDDLADLITYLKTLP